MFYTPHWYWCDHYFPNSRACHAEIMLCTANCTIFFNTERMDAYFRAGQWAQVAFVTFKEPYALQTAVLLSGATIIDQQVCIVPSGGSEEAVNRWKKQMIKFHEEGNTLGAVNVVTTMLSKGYTLGKDTLSKAKELDEKYEVMDTAAAKVADFCKFFGEISKEALIAAGHAACTAGTAAVNSSYFAAGALKGLLEFLTGQAELLLILVIGIMQ